MGLFSCFSKKDKKVEQVNDVMTEEITNSKTEIITYEQQLNVFESLGYKFNSGMTKEIFDLEVNEKIAWEDITAKEYFENNPFSALYYLYGWRNPEVPEYNFSEHCIHFDLEFFDPNSQYKWFMERMGEITNGEIKFTEINIETDSENWEWISFKVNGINKKWKLEKSGFIADHFVQRFSYLPKELGTKGKYTYFDDGGQQWIIDYATDEEQLIFNSKTGLKREWLGVGNHFSEPNE
jgi:hypothetical protein